MSGWRLSCALVGLLCSFWPAALLAGEEPDNSLAGIYDGSRPELATQLELQKTGRFRFALIYGAADMWSEGNWREDGNCAILRSDTFRKPAFRLVADRPLPQGELTLAMEVSSDAQYFDYILDFAEESESIGQMSPNGVSYQFEPDAMPKSVRLRLGIYALESADYPLTGGNGHALTFAFEPNQLGAVDFLDARACLENGSLSLPVLSDVVPLRKIREAED